jgi:hypothetical protein
MDARRLVPLATSMTMHRQKTAMAVITLSVGFPKARSAPRSTMKAITRDGQRARPNVMLPPRKFRSGVQRTARTRRMHRTARLGALVFRGAAIDSARIAPMGLHRSAEASARQGTGCLGLGNRDCTNSSTRTPRGRRMISGPADPPDVAEPPAMVKTCTREEPFSSSCRRAS